MTIRELLDIDNAKFDFMKRNPMLNQTTDFVDVLDALIFDVKSFAFAMRHLSEATTTRKFHQIELSLNYNTLVLQDRLKDKLTDDEVKSANEKLVLLSGHIDLTMTEYEEFIPKPKSTYEAFIKAKNELSTMIECYNSSYTPKFLTLTEALFKWNNLSQKERESLNSEWEAKIDAKGKRTTDFLD
jgi:hypothetical protein